MKSPTNKVLKELSNQILDIEKVQNNLFEHFNIDWDTSFFF